MTPRRTGFTLIELLVVIGILSVLSALAVGTYFRLKLAQQDKASEEILVRFSTGLERLTKAALDQARQDVREDRPVCQPAVRMSQVWVNPSAAVPPQGDPDRDRTASIWAYLRLKSDLPQTFDEAAIGVVGHQPSPGPPIAPFGNPGPLVTLIGPKPTFRQLVGFAAPSATNWTWTQLLRSAGGPRDYALEAAALLYQILSERGVRGELAGDDIGGSQVTEVEASAQTATYNPTTGAFGTPTAQANPVRVRVFRDVYGTPITFVRFARNDDIRTTNPNGGPPVDPLDPQGRLRVVLTGTVPGWGDGPPNANPANRFRLGFLDAMRYTPVVSPPASPYPAPIDFPTAPLDLRWQTTLLSASSASGIGPRKWDPLNDYLERAITGGGTAPAAVLGPSLVVTLPPGTPYLYSYSAR